jgi:glycolate oxidase FAD binding subunit
MIPLDPPFSDAATVGGVVAANTSGPRRRLYGTARDLIIGMKFVTLEGKVVQSGGMVVKNVAGLDMAKLMIGSFGTLAAIAVVNFKLIPTPEATQTFVRSFATVEQAIASRDELIRSVLQPSAIDLLNPAAAERVGLSGWCLAIQAGGSPAVLARYERELGGADRFSGDTEDRLWANIREFTPCWLTDHPHGSVLRVSTKLDGVGVAISQAAGPAVARAGTGIVYVYSKEPVQANGKAVVEYAPADVRETMCLWPDPGSDFAMMKKIKELFDPRQFLNRRRLYGRI